VLFKEAFGFAAIAAPGSGIDQHLHPPIISTGSYVWLVSIHDSVVVP
jgi:hypothetical protein